MEELEPIAPQEGKQALMINIDANLIIAGGSVGSAKSHSALMRSLRFIDDPHYRAGYFRRNTDDLRGPGGLFEEAKEMYERFGITVKDKEMKIIFDSGAIISFHHLDDENKVRQRFSGLQFTAIFIDEVQYWSENSVLFLMSRLRSKSIHASYMFLTCNPEPPPHWLHKWVDWYLLHEEDVTEEDSIKIGRANQEKTGIIRYYLMRNGSPVFCDNQEQLIQDYPELCYIEDPVSKETKLVPPKSFTFIGATMFDNPILIRMRPEYLQEMNAQEEIERERLLFGNWYVQPKGANFFDRNWLTEVAELPDGCTHCRAWDKAGTEPHDGNKNPDYTACSPLFSRDKQNIIYISWGVHPDIKDSDSEVVTGQFRKKPGARDALILKQAEYDGNGVTIVLSQDAGAAGAQEYEAASRELASKGFLVMKDPMPHNSGKLAKFSPFSSACENGNVKIVKSSFPNQQTYEAFMKHLEVFHGGKSRGIYHDDWADATASAYNYITRAKNLLPFTMPDSAVSSTSRYSQVMSSSTNPNFGESLMGKGGHIV